MERESETGIDTSTLTREVRKPKLSSEKARKLQEELLEEPEELEEPHGALNGRLEEPHGENSVVVLPQVK